METQIRIRRLTIILEWLSEETKKPSLLFIKRTSYLNRVIKKNKIRASEKCNPDGMRNCFQMEISKAIKWMGQSNNINSQRFGWKVEDGAFVATN